MTNLEAQLKRLMHAARLNPSNEFFLDGLDNIMRSINGFLDAYEAPIMPPPKDTTEAELIVRLEEIAEAEEPEFALNVQELHANMRTLAFALLVLLRREESTVFKRKHIFDSHSLCMLCGKSRSEIELYDGPKTCSAGI